MRGKIAFLLGVALGYVLGTRAGHQRYEQIKAKSGQLWRSEPVQQKVSAASDAVKAQAPVVQQKVTEAAKHAGEAARSKLSSDSDESADTAPHDRAPEDASYRPSHL